MLGGHHSKGRPASTPPSSSKRVRRNQSAGGARKADDTRDNDDLISHTPSPNVTPQVTLPSATPKCQDESSRVCATQMGTVEDELPCHTMDAHSEIDITQNISAALQVEHKDDALLVTYSANGPDSIPSDPSTQSVPGLIDSRKNEPDKADAKKAGTSSFFPPQLIGMPLRRARRVHSTAEHKKRQDGEKRTPKKASKTEKQQLLPQKENEGSDSNSKNESRKSEERQARRKKREQENKEARDQRFFKRVEKYKNRKVEMECCCPVGKCEGCEAHMRMTGYCMKTSARACWVVCLPPLLNCILTKAAFWPPTCEYYFFQEAISGTEEKDPILGTTVKNKMKKANKASLNQAWRFGFEHPCYKPLNTKYVECFTIETKKHHYLACVLVRTPSKAPKYTLLYSHPNGSDISDHFHGVPSLPEIAKFLDVDIVIYDYSGYGISSGSSNEKSIFADIEGVYKHLLNVRKVDPSKIVIYGYSIGTAAAIALMSEIQPPVAGVILLAPLTSMLRVLMWKRACFNQPFSRRKPCVDKFRSVEKIQQVTVPILVCHGENDIVVPIEHGKAIYEKAPNKVPPLWVPATGHNNLENTKELWLRVRRFLYTSNCPNRGHNRRNPARR